MNFTYETFISEEDCCRTFIGAISKFPKKSDFWELVKDNFCEETLDCLDINMVYVQYVRFTISSADFEFNYPHYTTCEAGDKGSFACWAIDIDDI